MKKAPSFTKLRDQFCTHMDWAFSTTVCLNCLETIQELDGKLRPSCRGDIFITGSLWSNLIVSYGHIFSTQENGRGAQRLNPAKVRNEGFCLAIHSDLMSLRNQMIAHTDRSFHQSQADVVSLNTGAGGEVSVFYGMNYRGRRLEAIQLADDSIHGHLKSLNRYIVREAQNIVTNFDQYFEDFWPTLQTVDVTDGEPQSLTFGPRESEVKRLTGNLKRVEPVPLQTLKAVYSAMHEDIPTRNPKVFPSAEVAKEDWPAVRAKFIAANPDYS